MSQEKCKNNRFIVKFVYFCVQMCISCTLHSEPFVLHGRYTKLFVYLTCAVRSCWHEKIRFVLQNWYTKSTQFEFWLKCLTWKYKKHDTNCLSIYEEDITRESAMHKCVRSWNRQLTVLFAQEISFPSLQETRSAQVITALSSVAKHI